MQTKEQIRKNISDIKKKHSVEELFNQSKNVIEVLEATDVFWRSKSILLYNNMKDEVDTGILINKYKEIKKFYLPVVNKQEILISEYYMDMEMRKSALGVLEPVSYKPASIEDIDLVIVPGIAFDRNLNRLGRGKGYYDRFLKQIKVHKVGLSFDFQLMDTIPTESHDVPLDMIVLENEIISDGLY